MGRRTAEALVGQATFLRPDGTFGLAVDQIAQTLGLDSITPELKQRLLEEKVEGETFVQTFQRLQQEDWEDRY